MLSQAFGAFVGSAMRDLNYQLKQLCDRNRDGSYATQSDRARILSHGDQLHDLRYRQMNADSLRSKHVDALVQQWKADGVSAGTMKSSLSATRWWAQKIRQCLTRAGPRSSQLSLEQRQRDLLVTEELGHGREQITAGYLGR